MIDESRLTSVWEFMAKAELDAFIIMNLEGFTLHSPNAGYLNGLVTALHNEALLLRDTREMYLITDSRYAEEAKSVFPESHIRILMRLRDIATLIPEAAKRIGFEDHVFTYSAYTTFKELFGVSRELIPVKEDENPVIKLRRHKTESELKLLSEAQMVSESAIVAALDRIRPGMTEIAIAAHVEFEMKRLGASATAFDSIVASGFRSALPHGRASEKPISRGDLIQFDVGAKYKGYCGDISRAAFVGEPDAEMLKVFDAVADTLAYAISLCKPGANCKSLHEQATARLGDYAPYFKHGLGHGVGLDIHEAPSLSIAAEKNTLEVGDVVTIEPGVYFPGKFGIRLEEMIAIREDGAEVFGSGTLPNDKIVVINS